jgi:DNA recombination protein RmuC
MEIAIGIICAILGVAVGFLLGRNRKRESELEAQVRVLESANANLKEQALRDKEEWQTHTREMLDSQQAKFDETIAKVTAQMKSATEDMLKRRQEEFAASSNSSLGQIVNPLKETIDKMKEAMHENTLKQTSISSEIKTQAENMMRQSAAAKQSADELTRVFRHAGRVQGNWGEIILDELLESQGLTKGVHYDIQSSIRDAAGDVVRNDSEHSMRPDVILHLDMERDVIIDSKVSLTAFMDYVNSDDENERQRYLKAHVDSIQKHVKELSAKDYSSYVKPPKIKMDYVIMFVPNTGALWTAVKAQPDLWRNAMEKNVYIADEQTLFAALRIISMTWTQIRQAENHEKVYELANEMMDRVGQFMDRYKAIGKALENAGKAYEAADKKLQPSGQSIIQTCAKLQKLGAKQSSKNPIPQLTDQSALEDISDDAVAVEEES